MASYCTQIQPLTPSVAQFVQNWQPHDSSEHSYDRRMLNRGKVPERSPRNHVTNWIIATSTYTLSMG